MKVVVGLGLAENAVALSNDVMCVKLSILRHRAVFENTAN
jgi:hypothetical protein